MCKICARRRKGRANSRGVVSLREKKETRWGRGDGNRSTSGSLSPRHQVDTGQTVVQCTAWAPESQEKVAGQQPQGQPPTRQGQPGSPPVRFLTDPARQG